MAKIKTQPEHDSSIHVFWLERPDGGYDQVIVSVDAASIRGAAALRVVAPAGEEVVFFAGEQVPREFRAFKEEPEYATYPAIQVFLQPGLDELRENPDAEIREGEVWLKPYQTTRVSAEPPTLEFVAREMFPVEYAAIDDDHPMDPLKTRLVHEELNRRLVAARSAGVAPR